ncbi:MAG: DJ-1/PfpI family protein [Gallionella sp.]
MKTVLVLFATGSEELEAITVVNILRRAGLTVTLAGLEAGNVIGSRGVNILPDTSLDAVQDDDFDLIVLPGGMPGTTHLRADKRVIQLVQKMSQQGKLVAAICAAPSVLACAGLLAGKRATCYPSFLDEFQNIQLQTSAVVQDSNIITSRGPGTAMDFALTLVERLLGTEKRLTVEAELVR